MVSWEQQNRYWVESGNMSFHRKYYLFFVEDFPAEAALNLCDIKYLQIHNIFGLDWSDYELSQLTSQTYSIYFLVLSQRENNTWNCQIIIILFTRSIWLFWYNKNVLCKMYKVLPVIWIITDCKFIIFTRLTTWPPKETQLNCHRGAVKELFLRYQNTNQFLHMLR